MFTAMQTKLSPSKGLTLVELLIAVALMGIIFVGLTQLLKSNTQNTTNLSRAADAQAIAKVLNTQIKNDLVNAGGGLPKGTPWSVYDHEKLKIRYLDQLKKYCAIGSASTTAPQVVEIRYYANPPIKMNEPETYGTEVIRQRYCDNTKVDEDTLIQIPDGVRLVFNYYQNVVGGSNVYVGYNSSKIADYVKMDLEVKTKPVGTGKPIQRKITSRIQLINL